jgi:hypothetical protein
MINYDLALAAQSGLAYAEQFPSLSKIVPFNQPLAKQLPDGVSWAATLPGVFKWLSHSDVASAVDRARQERVALFWTRATEP